MLIHQKRIAPDMRSCNHGILALSRESIAQHHQFVTCSNALLPACGMTASAICTCVMLCFPLALCCVLVKMRQPHYAAVKAAHWLQKQHVSNGHHMAWFGYVAMPDVYVTVLS